MVILSCSSEDENPLCEQATIVHDVVFDPHYVDLPNDLSILGFRALVNDEPSYCSGFAITATTLLTAAHCAPLFDADVEVIDFPDIEITAYDAHPTADIMMIQISEPVSTPIPLVGEIDDEWIGRGVTTAGYGRTHLYQPGVRHYYSQFISEINDQSIKVDTFSSRGICSGDSGGPILGRDDSGRLVALGVLSTSSSSCAGTGFYARTDVVADWLPQRLPSPKITCEGLTNEGACDVGRAVYCDNGNALATTCDSCGWNPNVNGWRCDSNSDCDPQSRKGWCEGDVVRKCIDGKLASIDCTRCDATCGVDMGTGDAGCLSE